MGRTKSTTRNTSKKSTRSPKKKESSSFLGKEIRGLLYIAIAVLAFLHIVGYELGYGGDFIGYIFTFGFGIGALLPALLLAYMGVKVIVSDHISFFSMRNVLWFLLFASLLGMISLWSIPVGKELDTQYLENYGGVLGGLVAFSLHRLVGETGAIIVDFVIMLVLLLAVTKLSLRSGIKKVSETAAPMTNLAMETADYGVQVVKEKAAEKIDHARHKVEAWQDAKRASIAESKQALAEKRERRKAFDREKFGDSPGIAAKAEVEASPILESPIVPIPPVEDVQAIEDIPVVEASMVEDLPVMEEAPIIEEVPVVDTMVETMEDSEEPPVEEPVAVEDVLEVPAFLAEEEAKEVVAPAAPVTPSISAEQVEELSPAIPVLPFEVPAFEGTAADTAAVSVSQTGEEKKHWLGGPYHFPPMSMLKKGSDPVGMSEEVAQNAALLESTLESFGVKAHIINATQGPAVTRYELEPAPGVKVSKIVNLTDDIALNLAAAGIRMEAPIPGKAAIGIEIPNKEISPVFLRDVLDNDEFKKASGGIPVGLGKDIAGKPIITDLSKMPHLLVAGSTGSGKSVCINTLIASILFSRKPEDVKLILIDPKMVELSNYNGVPHLMVPVVTDMKKAATVLKWAVKEMESRYRTFAATNVRDVKRYNELHPETAMPLVVLIIDELADLMMVAPVDIEDSIARLAQMARAAGIHLVLATQRPSVDVITGTIKANVPSRISFAVSSQIDSRTILDMAGAEKLLGKGDMLFNPIGASKPIRIQGAFISDDEVEALVDFIKKQGAPTYDESIFRPQESEVTAEDDSFFEDPLLEKAIDLVYETGQASASMLQRRFRIGYTRAARLIDILEQMEIVGPSMGSKPRELLMSQAAVKEKFFSNRQGEEN